MTLGALNFIDKGHTKKRQEIQQIQEISDTSQYIKRVTKPIKMNFKNIVMAPVGQINMGMGSIKFKKGKNMISEEEFF